MEPQLQKKSEAESKDRKILTEKEKTELLEKLTKEQNERLAQREENLKYINSVPDLPKTLTSKIDRVQKFLTKLRNLKEDSKESLIEEMNSLNLTRYVSEIVEIIAVSKLQLKDLVIVIEICVSMHRRYKDFAATLVPVLQKQFQVCTGCTDEPSKALKRRQILKLLTELYLKGVINEINRIGKCLKEVLTVDRNKDRERFSHNMSLLSSYLKQYGEVLFGILSRKTRIAIEAGEFPKFERYAFVNPKQREVLLNEFRKFFGNCCEFMMEEHKQLKDQEEKVAASMKEIDIDKEVEKKYITMRTAFDKNWGTLVHLADSLDCDIPQQIEEKVSLVTSKAQPKSEELQPGSEKTLFEDETQRAFYRDLIELKVDPKTEPEKEKEAQEKDSWKPELDEILKKLPNCVTKEQVDEIAKEFFKISNKKTRKILVKTMFNIPRTALPLIPLYARLAATLNKVWKDVGNNLVDMLEKEFNELYESNDLIKIETKVRNIRFLGELTKFEVCNHNTIFNCLKRCLEDFLGHNVDIVCHLLETAGVYLSKLPSTHIRLINTIDLMWKVAKTKHLSAQAEANIENVYYLCKHPDRYGKRQKKEKPILEQYIRYLIYEKLNADNIEEVAGLICRLPLNNDSVIDYLQNCIMKLTFYGKFTNMDVVSCLLACLKTDAEYIVIRVVDAVVEDIIQGLERNDYKESQHRLLAIRFLGELYRFTVINSDLIFTVLHILIDTNNERKYPDSKDDSFRVRMACTLLDTCGKKFEKGEKRQKLNAVLMYLQRYMLGKSYMSLDLQFMVLDTYEALRPEMTLFKTYEEAVDECKKMESGAKPAIPDEDGKEKGEEELEEQKEPKEQPKEEEALPKIENEEENPKEYDRGVISSKLDDELSAIIKESIKEAKKQSIFKKMDIPVPVIKKEPEKSPNADKFAFMTKKGPKAVIKKIAIPSDSKLAIAHQQRVTEEEEERQRMKELTLHMAEHEEKNEAMRMMGFPVEVKQRPKAEDQLARGKKKIHFNYKDFDA